MESYGVLPLTKLGTLTQSFNKFLRFYRSVTSSVNGAGVAPDEGDLSIHKLKVSQNISDHSTGLSEVGDDSNDKHEKQQQEISLEEEAMKSILANLFASIAAIKAAYAQLQRAQSPYDPDLIQSSDLAIVNELKRVSELKKSYFENQCLIPYPCDTQSVHAAQIEEQRNLIKIYQITLNNLKADLQLKNSVFFSLETELRESENRNQALKSKIQPSRSVSALDDLHTSTVNSTHFLDVLRRAFKSIRSFVKLMVKEMESAGWDLDAAAGAIQPDVFPLKKPKPAHWTFAFQSFVCQRMFSDFHHKSYNLPGLEERETWGWHEFFNEFIQLRHVEKVPELCQNSAIAHFFRIKYLALVHPKMESSFFGNLDQRIMLSFGQGFPNSAFFTGFAEMARRVWLLHCLFFSFKQEADRSIFQARRGIRFSELYMESVGDVDDDDDDDDDWVGPAMVGFTVVPGFRISSTLIQCKVYLMRPGRRVSNGRSG